MHWISHINELIEAGQNASREESAEMLGWLLNQAPDDCWRLLQARDPCLNKLTSGDYQYLLAKTVEARTAAIWRDLLPVDPLVTRMGAPPPLLTAPPANRAGLPRRFFKWFLILLVLVASQFATVWIVNESSHARLALLEKGSEQIQQTLDAARTDFARNMTQTMRYHSQRELQQQQATLTLMALENLRVKLVEGVPFSYELAALQTVWKTPGELLPLGPLAAQGVPSKPALEGDLRRAIDDLAAQRLELQRTWYIWPWLWNIENDARQQIQRLQSLENQASQALTLWHKGDWQGAMERLVNVEQDKLKRWRQSAMEHIKAEQLVVRLLRQAWSGFSQTSAVPESER